MNDTEVAQPRARFQIAEVVPAPADDVLAAIVAALEVAWPEPSTPDAWRSRPQDDHWRFSQRPWLGRPIPLRNWGRT